MKCEICDSDSFEPDDSFDCDGCFNKFHSRCVGIKKSEFNARKGSKFLRMYCNGCSDGVINSMAENINLIRQLCFKIDMTTQKQHEQNMAFEVMLQRLGDDMSNVKLNINEMKKSNNNNNGNGKSSYADSVKSSLHPAVVIKPKKTNQSSGKTMSDLKNNINHNEINACGLRNVKGGGILINCNSVNATMKVKKLVEDKIGKDYEVNLPQIKKPRIKIVNVMEESIDNESFIADLKSQNPQLEPISLEIKAVLKKKRNNSVSFDVVMETDHIGYELLMDMKKVKFGWNICKVFDHIHIKRCYNCCGFQHVSNQCKNEVACSHCGDKHKKSNECSLKTKCCINCKNANVKLNLKLNTEHDAWSRECNVLQRKIKQLKRSIQFNDK